MNQPNRLPLRSLLLLAFVPFVRTAGAAAPAAVVPTGSGMDRAAGLQRLLLSPLDTGAGIGKDGWRLEKRSAAPAPRDVAPKVGSAALVLQGEAQVAGAKGDFSLTGAVPGECRWLGMWVHLRPGANVESVGFQLHDAEGESLVFRVPADWQGWKWVEADLRAPGLVQAYEQVDKNRKLDLPLRGVHAVWFSKGPGPSAIGIDALVAAVEPGSPAVPPRAELTAAPWVEPGQPAAAQVVLTNYGAAAPARVEVVVQRDPALYSTAPPDPVHGTDHALGARSWTEVEGKRIEEGSLTDGRDWTAAETGYRTSHHKEALQFVDLGRERRVTHLAYRAGDANWVWKVDVAASADGRAYQPVPSLQGVELHKRWGEQSLPLAAPVTARYLRLRYHNDGTASDVIRMPVALSVYDGTADEKWEIPTVGEVVARESRTQEVPARSFAVLSLAGGKPLPTGAYLVSARVQAGGATQLLHRHLFVLPAPLKARSAASRFGLNSSSVEHHPSHERLGVGWVRFENLKWPMVSPQPGVYRYDGSVGPWHVDHDRIMDGYTAQGLNVLPFLFLTADYASSAPAGVPPHRRSSYPPRDNAAMAEFVFQTVARYGSARHPTESLKTPDRKSGLGKVHVYEIWNEPNLTAPEWGPWVGTAPQYLEMFRAAAEAVKQADPKARVTNGGYAGIDVETVDELRAYRYADGRRPLDFVDVLNVHFYSGRTAPEIARVDTNVDRSGSPEEGRTYEDDLRRLSAWRDRHKPGMPVWLTETGYDTGGPWGVSEQWQAARLPRVLMLALANGIEKAFVYRESGSTPSLHAASGLFRDDGTVKPSWFTYATLVRELDGAKDGRRLPYPDPNVRLYAWTRGTERILTAWTVDDTADLKLQLGDCTVTDAFGHRKTRKAVQGLRLSLFPTYVRQISSPAAVDALIGKARQEEAARARETARQAKLRAYLFDFGSKDRVGTAEIGILRSFTPVVAADTYQEARGYGFTPEPGMQDDVRNWMRSPLDRDSVRVRKGIRFQFRAAKGRYRLKVGASSFAAAEKLTVTGGVGGPKLVQVLKDGPAVELPLEVGDAPVSLEIEGYANLRWLTLVEE